jgi:hypothetical protein
MKANLAINRIHLENHTPRLLALALLSILLLGVLAGCKSKSASAEPASVNPVGVYSLVSMDGKPVPCTITHDGRAMGIQSGTFTITADGWCDSLMVISVGSKTNIHCQTHATYTLSGDELTMRWKNAGWTKGHVAGDTFTMMNEGMELVYQR